MNPLCCRIMFLCNTFNLLSQISLHTVDSCWVKQDLKDFMCCHVGELAAQFSVCPCCNFTPPSLPPSLPGGLGPVCKTQQVLFRKWQLINNEEFTWALQDGQTGGRIEELLTGRSDVTEQLYVQSRDAQREWSWESLLYLKRSSWPVVCSHLRGRGWDEVSTIW